MKLHHFSIWAELRWAPNQCLRAKGGEAQGEQEECKSTNKFCGQNLEQFWIYKRRDMKQVERMCFSGSLQQNSSGCSARCVDIWKSKSKTVVSAIARVRASKHAQPSEKMSTTGMEFTSRIDTLKRRMASTRDLFAHQRHCPESYILCCDFYFFQNRASYKSKWTKTDPKNLPIRRS